MEYVPTRTPSAPPSRPDWLTAGMFLYLGLVVGLYASGAWLARRLGELLGPMPVRGGLWTWAWSVDGVGPRQAAWIVGATAAGALVAAVWSRRSQRLRWHTSAPLRALVLAAASLCAGLALWYFRVGRSLGDSINYLLAMRDGQVFFMSQPLSTMLFAAAHDLLTRLGWPTQPSLALVTCLAGAVWIFLLLKLADEWPGWNGQLLLAGGLFAGGTAVFFGYIEATPIGLAAALGYVVAGWRALAGRGLPLAGLAYGLALAAHGQMVFLAPSFLVICLAAGRQGKWRPVIQALLLALLPGALIVGYALTHPHLISGKVYGDALGGGDQRMFVPLLERATASEHYTLFSFNYFTELINLALRTTPLLALLLVPAAWGAWHRRREWSAWFLTSIAGGGLLFVAVWNPDLGMPHDWDLFAPPLMLSLVAAAGLWPLWARPRWEVAWLGAAGAFSLTALAVTVSTFSPAQAWDPWDIAWTRLPSPPYPRFGEAIELVGYGPERTRYAPGESLVVHLYWRARRRVAVEYTAGVYLIRPAGGAGTVIAQDDHRPEAPVPWPDPRFTPGWMIGEVVHDSHTFTIPPATPPGRYPIWLTLYELDSLTRLPVSGGEGTDYLRLAEIEITSGE